jgi:hypothetical protein
MDTILTFTYHNTGTAQDQALSEELLSAEHREVLPKGHPGAENSTHVAREESHGKVEGVEEIA